MQHLHAEHYAPLEVSTNRGQHQFDPKQSDIRPSSGRSMARMMLPTIGGHLERSIVLRMEVLHGTQTSQALHA